MPVVANVGASSSSDTKSSAAEKQSRSRKINHEEENDSETEYVSHTFSQASLEDEDVEDLNEDEKEKFTWLRRTRHGVKKELQNKGKDISKVDKYFERNLKGLLQERPSTATICQKLAEKNRKRESHDFALGLMKKFKREES